MWSTELVGLLKIELNASEFHFCVCGCSVKVDVLQVHKLANVHSSTSLTERPEEEAGAREEVVLAGQERARE